MDAGWLTCLRMFVAGVILLTVSAIKSPRSLKKVWTDRKDALRLVIFAVAGLMTIQYSYLRAISFSNAGTATALQYLSEAMILLCVCLRTRRRPVLSETLGLLLALVGIFLLATHGDPSTMVLSREGLFWGLVSAISMTLYTLLPGQLTQKYGSLTVTGYGMLIGGSVLTLILRPWNISVNLDAETIIAVAAVVLIGTVAGFTLYIMAISNAGPLKTGLLASSETVAAPLFAFLWLGTGFETADIAGFLCIIAMVILISLPGLRSPNGEKHGIC